MTQDVHFHSGHDSSGGEENTVSIVIDKNEELDTSVSFSDGGMGNRYRGDKWNGIHVLDWSTNADAHPEPEKGYIEVTVRRGIPRSLGTTVTIRAYAEGTFLGAGNWMEGNIRVHTRPFRL